MKFAACFPGQGSQYVGMLAELASQHSSVKDIFSAASRALDFDLLTLSLNGPEQELNLTYHTQPALLAAGVACYRVWQELGGQAPSLLAGHSLGEYSALVCAESLRLEDAVRLVAMRGRLMQQAVPEGAGAMAAIIGLEDDIIIALCEDASRETQAVVSAANFNCPGQVVIAGHTDAVNQACAKASDKGARLTSILPVSVPSHCHLMQSAADELTKELENTAVTSPTLPIIHNVDGKRHDHPDDIRQALVQQLTSPVRWAHSINVMLEDSVDTFIEFGPGRVLTGLNKRINRQASHLTLNEPDAYTAYFAKLQEEV